MKRIICIILLIVLSFILCSCYSTNSDIFPQLRIAPSDKYADYIYIALRDDHNFNIQHLYEEVETENGYDIIVHIVKNK